MKLPDTPAARLALRTVDRLRAAGHQAYLVGGCVRDLLLGTAPKDFDVTTDAPPARVLELFPGAEPVGSHFGVVIVPDGGVWVEVATFRRDHTYEDGRRPSSVDFETDPRQDVLRRDFTINAMMLDPVSGSVIDHTGGRRDLDRRVVRTVGDPATRFAEDHLRMLRAVRFAARLDFAIEEATAEAIRGERASIHRVAAERVRDELTRILTEGGARRGFEFLDGTGLLGELLPEVAAMKGVEQPPEYHPEGDVWTHTLLMLGLMRDPSPSLAWGVLLHDVGKPPTFRLAERIRFDRHAPVGAEMAERILKRLRCSRELVHRVTELVRRHLQFIDVRKMRQSTLKRFLRMEGFDELLELHRIDCLASHRDLTAYNFVRAQLTTLSSAQLRPAPLLTGRDLIAAGYEPGPSFQQILETVETAQLESRVHSPEDALTLVRSRFPPPDGRPADGPAKPGDK